MQGLWFVTNILLPLFYPEVAIISWYHDGRSELWTFLVMISISTLSILASYGLFSGLVLAIKRTLKLPQVREAETRLMKFFHMASSPAMVKKLGERLGNFKNFTRYKYLILFVLNLIPFVPYLTLITIIAAKAADLKWPSLLVIIAGNTIKIYLLVKVIYIIGQSV